MVLKEKLAGLKGLRIAGGAKLRPQFLNETAAVS